MHSKLKLFHRLCCYRYKSTDIIKYNVKNLTNMKNYLFLLNGVLYLIKLCCLAQNINLTNYQDSKNALVILKYYKNMIRRDCKL